MSAIRPFALIQTNDQWARCAHQNTTLLPDVLQLRFHPETKEVDTIVSNETTPSPAGLAFDPWCRLYHSLPDAGQVERLFWSPDIPAPSDKSVLKLFEQPDDDFGDFGPAESTTSPLNDPRGLAVDSEGRLFVAETGAARALVYDLLDRRLIRQVSFPPSSRALEFASEGRTIHVLLAGPPFIVSLEARSEPKPVAIDFPDFADLGSPSRIALHPVTKELFLLFNASTENAIVAPLTKSGPAIETPFATDIEFVPDRTKRDRWLLVVAREPDTEFARYFLETNASVRYSNLRARGYDGCGIVRTPDDRIGYWTNVGFRHATTARPRYATTGRVTTFQLDSGRFQTQWGRIFLDACIPKETSVRVHCVAADEIPDEQPLARTPPVAVELVVPSPHLSPPMPPKRWVTGDVQWQRLHERETGRELPWIAREDEFATFEAPVTATPGRYLWVTLMLTGNTHFTPKIKSVRAEYPSHELMRRLPKVYSREHESADFLRRYLATFEGTLGHLDARSTDRHALVNPWATPVEMLPWLASFLGMVLDRRWPERTKRAVVSEAISLFRRRGTVGGLKRFLELYLGVDVNIVEKFRLRGLGGAQVGTGEDRLSNAVVGQFRIGGAIGRIDEQTKPPPDAYATHAHRFSVIIPASLSAEQTDVVRHLLDVHRPAHTLFDLCTVDSGLRIGRGSYLDLTTVIGRSAMFGQLQTGHSVLGTTDVLGRPQPGIHVGSSHLGQDTRGG